LLLDGTAASKLPKTSVSTGFQSQVRSVGTNSHLVSPRNAGQPGLTQRPPPPNGSGRRPEFAIFVIPPKLQQLLKSHREYDESDMPGRVERIRLLFQTEWKGNSQSQPANIMFLTSLLDRFTLSPLIRWHSRNCVLQNRIRAGGTEVCDQRK
jgi:hypothetical protein